MSEDSPLDALSDVEELSPAPFEVLSDAQFEALSPQRKLLYLVRSFMANWEDGSPSQQEAAQADRALVRQSIAKALGLEGTDEDRISISDEDLDLIEGVS